MDVPPPERRAELPRLAADAVGAWGARFQTSRIEVTLPLARAFLDDGAIRAAVRLTIALVSAGNQLRKLLAFDGMLTAPGAYDGITARMIEQAGFKVIYMTGAGTAATLGYPV